MSTKTKTTPSRQGGTRSRPSAIPRHGTERVEETSESSVRAIFLRRMRTWTRDLARTAPSSLLADALAQPSARGTMVHLLSVFAPSAEESEVQQLRRRARERALVVQEELRRAAGGFHATGWVADHLQIRRQSVDKRRREGRLLALATPSGYAFPGCQFTTEGTVPGLEDVLGVMRAGGFWETLAGLVTPSPALDGKTVIEALQGARTAEEQCRVVAVAQAYVTG